MKTLYLITGPAGVGKSTISTQIAKSKNKSALIEGDDIYHQVVGGYVQAWKSGNHLEIFWKVCIDTISTYLSNGYDVIFNYIINPSELKKLKDSFSKFNIKFIVLLTDEKTLLYRDSLRPEECQMKERSIVLLNNFKNMKYDNYILDTTNLSIEETIREIENGHRFYL